MKATDEYAGPTGIYEAIKFTDNEGKTRRLWARDVEEGNFMSGNEAVPVILFTAVRADGSEGKVKQLNLVQASMVISRTPGVLNLKYERLNEVS